VVVALGEARGTEGRELILASGEADETLDHTVGERIN
jgi:hypothetical protein